MLADAINGFLDDLVPSDSIALSGDVLSLIHTGESAILEFKASLRTEVPGASVNKVLERVVVKTIAGFLNGQGGNLLIGVADSGDILGLDQDYASSQAIQDRDGFELHLTKLLSNALGMSAQAFVTVTFHSVGGKDVCQVATQPSDHPIYVDDGGSSIFYLRTGNATNPLPVDETVQYYKTRWT